MAMDMNVVTLVCRATRDPELRHTKGGTAVTQIRAAFTTSRKNGDGWEDKSNFVDVTVFGRQAESVAEYVRKGHRVGVTGRLEWSEWETDGGDKRSKLEVVADRIHFLQPRDQDTTTTAARSDWEPVGPAAPATRPPTGRDDSDIPFTPSVA